MISERQNAAIRLRNKGMSVKAIAKKLGAAQSSVSIWVRDTKLTEDQTARLHSNTHSPRTVEKRRQARIRNESAKRTKIINDAKEHVGILNHRELWLLGTALYWAEGGKTQSVVRFSNGDPEMILLMLRFFRVICKIDDEKLRIHIHIHAHLDASAAEKYWQRITNIPPKHFYKTYNKPNKSSKATRNTLPYGVCDIYVTSSAKLLLTIKGWAGGIYESSIAMI
jgi:transposase